MKLRNKKTGEIVKLAGSTVHDGRVFFELEDEIGIFKREINSLNELNADWEDYEEPKEYWCIDRTGFIKHITVLDGVDKYEENKKEIGNYFDTREEAERALEKLKAWKRLKDNGFEFDGIRLEGNNCLIKTKLKDNTGVTFNHAQQFYEDVDLLFGGEECL